MGTLTSEIVDTTDSFDLELTFASSSRSASDKAQTSNNYDSNSSILRSGDVGFGTYIDNSNKKYKDNDKMIHHIPQSLNSSYSSEAESFIKLTKAKNMYDE